MLVLSAHLQTYKKGARFEALIEGILMAPLDSRLTQVEFNVISVQVCAYAVVPQVLSLWKNTKVWHLSMNMHS